MEHINQAINLLGDVLNTMDVISVQGFKNQSAFVGCGEAIQLVARLLEKHVQEAQVTAAQKNKKETEENKAPMFLQEGGAAKELTGQEEVNG